MTSPFQDHRSKVLGHYSTAAWLRSVVMALFSGSTHQVGLSQLASVDAEHFKAFTDMVAGYRQSGENDPAFMALAEECRLRIKEEEAAAKRADDLEWWIREARGTLRGLGLRPDLTDDRYSWFEAKFDAGMGPGEAAHEAARVKLS